MRSSDTTARRVPWSPFTARDRALGDGVGSISLEQVSCLLPVHTDYLPGIALPPSSLEVNDLHKASLEGLASPGRLYVRRKKTDLAIRLQQLSVTDDQLLDPGEYSLSRAVLTTSVDDPRYLDFCRPNWDQLKDECRSRSLNVEGSKHDLAHRLVESDDDDEYGQFRRSTFGRPLLSF